MKGEKKKRNRPGESERGETKKAASTTVFAMSESHKVVNYLKQTKWNLSECQNMFFQIYVQILTGISMLSTASSGNTCAMSELCRRDDVNSSSLQTTRFYCNFSTKKNDCC